MSGTRSLWAQQYGLTPRNLQQEAATRAAHTTQWWNPCWFSFAAAVALSILGIAAIHLTEDPGQSTFWGRQTVFLMVSITAFALCAIPSPRFWRMLAYPMTVIIILLLLFVLIPFVPSSVVKPINGARRWINFGVVNFQPSEAAKIVLVLALANYLRVRQNYRTLKGLVIPFAIMVGPTALILKEPDLGTALLFIPILFAMLMAAGAKLRHMFSISGLALATALMIAVVSFFAANKNPPAYPLLEKHQVERIQGLVNQIRGDHRQADTINFQAFKGETLIGAGGFWGLGEERARLIVEYNKLPFDHNDMIFAVVVCRWGFMGGVVIIGIYFVYILGMLGAAAMTMNPFGRLVCVGFATIIGSQMVVNIGMCLGLMPITGMTLPFISYGGSSLIVNFAMTGIAMSIALRPPEFFAKHSFEFDPKPEEKARFEEMRKA